MPDIFIAEPKAQTATAPNELTPLLDNEELQPPQNPVHLFSAFKKDPDGINFQDKEDDEKIILFIRRSFITNVRWIFFGSLLLVTPLFLLLIFYSIGETILQSMQTNMVQHSNILKAPAKTGTSQRLESTNSLFALEHHQSKSRCSYRLE
jgi:hypothetical protein